MFSNAHKEWLAEYSNFQEEMGVDPSYPLTAIQMHIKKELENQNKIIEYASKNLSDRIVNGIKDSTTAITGTLENGFNALIETNSIGFNQVSSDLNMINDTLGGIGNILDWGFSETIEQIKASNILLGNIAVLLKIAEFEKESEAYIKEGMKFFKNAMFNKKRYSDALDNFLLAEKLAKRNYFLLQKIGLVYLFSQKHLNIDLALNYFLKAADYSLDETRDNAVKTKNFLSVDASEDFNNYTTSVLSIKLQTAYSYIYAGRCYYLKKQYLQALEYATKANNLMPNLLEASYDRAKYSSLLGKIDISIDILDKIISLDKFIVLKVINDFDLISKPEVTEYIDKLRTKTVSQLKIELSHFEIEIDNSFIKSLVTQARNNLKLNEFLSARISIDNLNKQYNFNLEQMIAQDKDRYLYSLEKRNVTSNPKKVYSYLVFINDRKDTLQKYAGEYTNKESTIIHLKTVKGKLNTTKGKNKDAKGQSMTGILFLAIGFGGLFYIFSADSIWSILGWLLLFGFPLGYLILHGVIHLFGGMADIKGGKESNESVELNNLEIANNNLNQKMAQMLMEIKKMELDKLDKIL